MVFSSTHAQIAKYFHFGTAALMTIMFFGQNVWLISNAMEIQAESGVASHSVEPVFMVFSLSMWNKRHGEQSVTEAVVFAP